MRSSAVILTRQAIDAVLFLIRRTLRYVCHIILKAVDGSSCCILVASCLREAVRHNFENQTNSGLINWTIRSWIQWGINRLYSNSRECGINLMRTISWGYRWCETPWHSSDIAVMTLRFNIAPYSWAAYVAYLHRCGQCKGSWNFYNITLAIYYHKMLLE